MCAIIDASGTVRSTYLTATNLKGFEMSIRKKRSFRLRVSPTKLRLDCEYAEEIEVASEAVQIEDFQEKSAHALTLEHSDHEEIDQSNRVKKLSGKGV